MIYALPCNNTLAVIYDICTPIYKPLCYALIMADDMHSYAHDELRRF
jgi:hypothetical protein